jgi:hypothetical protein
MLPSGPRGVFEKSDPLTELPSRGSGMVAVWGSAARSWFPSEAVSPSWFSIGNEAASLDSSAAWENRLDLVDFKQSRVGQASPRCGSDIEVLAIHRGAHSLLRKNARPFSTTWPYASTVVEQLLMNPKLLIEIDRGHGAPLTTVVRRSDNNPTPRCAEPGRHRGIYFDQTIDAGSTLPWKVPFSSRTLTQASTFSTIG